MECFICTESNPEPIHLGCACRSGFAHIECMAKFIRTSQRFSRKCRTCNQRLTGRMLHFLNAYFSGEGELVCNIQELAEKLRAHNVPIIRPPINDQTCFRVSLSNSKHIALSIAACKPNNVYQDHFFTALFIDTNDRVVATSVKTFRNVDTLELINYIQTNADTSSREETNHEPPILAD